MEIHIFITLSLCTYLYTCTHHVFTYIIFICQSYPSKAVESGVIKGQKDLRNSSSLFTSDPVSPLSFEFIREVFLLTMVQSLKKLGSRERKAQAQINTNMTLITEEILLQVKLSLEKIQSKKKERKNKNNSLLQYYGSMWQNTESLQIKKKIATPRR